MTNTPPSFRFTILVSLFCVILVISNIASTKMVQLPGILNFGPDSILFPLSTSFGGIFSKGLLLDAGTILFPFSYIFGDIFAEVYGWKTSKKIILLGFAAIILNALILAIVQYLPAPGFWTNQSSYEAILGLVPRITLGSIFGYLAGSFSNAWSLLWIRRMTGERWLAMRTIGSTLIGQTADTVVFCAIAFLGTMGQIDLVHLAISNIIFKVAVEALFTPVTYRIVKWMK